MVNYRSKNALPQGSWLKCGDSYQIRETKALSQRIDQLQKNLGLEFVVLENILGDIDLKSPDGREIALIIQSLNQSCPSGDTRFALLPY
jgi:hypothetical protein